VNFLVDHKIQWWDGNMHIIIIIKCCSKSDQNDFCCEKV